MAEEQVTKEEAMKDCACGSGKMYGACCGMMKLCFCGSGKPVGQCCMANPEAHGVDKNSM